MNMLKEILTWKIIAINTLYQESRKISTRHAIIISQGVRKIRLNQIRSGKGKKKIKIRAEINEAETRCNTKDQHSLNRTML